ncbi:MAG: transcription antitermination factor NusB [Acidaminococcaceae bacterium]|nr:transcription antitermination factor NusB [Acidaminococcaceae bacterium]MDD4722591.1 transcription antitermination factor NusB [Acidaminococcaceae bacterium]
MSRRNAREIVLKSLFIMDFTPDTEISNALKVAEEEIQGATKSDVAYAKEVVEGTMSHIEEIDKELEETSKKWHVKRMAAIDRNLIRLAAYEMFMGTEKVPSAIAINEVVELAKLYGSDESAAYVNGILGKMVKNHDK